MYTSEYSEFTSLYDILDPDGTVIAQVEEHYVEALLSHLNRGEQ